jgi:hypothetical protein
MADPIVGITNGVPTSGTGTITTLGQTLVDGANATIGASTNAANPATNSTSVTAMSVWKQISASIQAAAASLVTLVTTGISITNANTNGSKTSANSAPVVVASDQSPIQTADQYTNYFPAAASATTLLGATGALGDYLAGVVVVPGTTAAGTVSFEDGNVTTEIFAGGGTSALSDLKPFFIPLGIVAKNATTPGFRLILGANVTAIGVGKFT